MLPPMDPSTPGQGEGTPFASRTENNEAETLRRRLALVDFVVDSLGAPYFVVDGAYRYLAFNKRHSATVKIKQGVEIGIGMSILECYADTAQRAGRKAHLDRALSGEGFVVRDMAGQEAAGPRYHDVSYAPVRDEAGRVFAVAVFASDRTESVKAAEEIQASREKYGLLFGNMTAAFALCRLVYDEYDKPTDLRILELNPAFEGIFGRKAGDLLDRLAGSVLPWIRDGFLGDLARVARTGQPFSRETHHEDLDRDLDIRAFRPGADQVAVTVTDITERIRGEKERARLEEQLFQAQKMESIGRLAGGVAHDFNNLLAPILGYTEMLLADMAPGADGREELEQVHRAAELARDLTRQLLAFGRRQILAMELLDLRGVVSGFERLLRRTIREDIALRVSLPDAPLPVRADAVQMEQVLMNLVVNAQDSMPDGGTLSIELARREIDDETAALRPEAPAGRYVRLAVSDTGHGMDAATQARLFEPFFTTKEKGKGTGLGLSTVYGIVKQHGGQITVYSEPEHGSSFSILLPMASGAFAEKAPARTLEAPGGHGTILVVEDNAEVRALACRMLQRLGYSAMPAGAPAEALEAMRAAGDSIRMVLTDIVMPGTDGRQLYRHLAAERPGLKVLFMSGYTEDTIAHHGILDRGIEFIQKPFTLGGLAAKLERILGDVVS